MRRTSLATSYSELCVIPSFRRYVCGQSFSMAGDAICLAALPIALINSGYDAATFGIIMACVGLGTFIGAGLGGSWTEYFSARTILIITDLVRGICQLVAAAVIAGMTHWCGSRLFTFASAWALAALALLPMSCLYSLCRAANSSPQIAGSLFSTTQSQCSCQLQWG